MATIQNQKTRRLDALSVRATRAFVDAGLHGVEASVIAAIDVSPPMAPLFIDGHIHELTTALLALGMRFDDDGVVPVWTFGGGEARLVGELQRGDHQHFVSRHVLAPAPLVPGQRPPPTKFAPLIDGIARREFPKEWAQPGTPRLREMRETPVFVIVVTGGDCHDVPETMRQLRRSSHLPIFWQFAAVAVPGIPSDFRFLRTVNELPDTFVDACGFFEPQDLADEDALFAGLLNEFPRYLALPAVQGMLLGPQATEEVDPADELISQTLLTLPIHEHERRQRAREARAARRDQRAAQAEDEIQRALAVPAIAHASEGEAERPSSEVRRAARLATATRPYREDELGSGEFPAIPALRKAARLSANLALPDATEPELAAVVPPGHDADDAEDTVQTTTERLARIRARRDARRHE